MSARFFIAILGFAAVSSCEAVVSVPSAVPGAPSLARAAAAATATVPGGGRILRLRGGHHEGYTLGVRDSIMIAHAFLV